MRILIVEDEQAIAEGLKFNFEQEGYETVVAHDGPAALEQFQDRDSPFDLIVLDLMLPGMSGYETCQEIRKTDPRIPILVLSARTLAEDKARAFDCGTDQYMTKPFALPELLSRVRNLLDRRPRAAAGTAAGGVKPVEPFEFGNTRVDYERFQVSVDGEARSLTTMEMQLLKYFIEHEGRVLSRSQILEDVWEESADLTTRTIDNFVMRLRRLIEENPSEPRHILSVRGTGYRFVACPDAENAEK